MAEHAEYIATMAQTHGIGGYDVTADNSIVYGKYHDGDYDLWIGDTQLTDADADLTAPEWLTGRDTILALRDANGTELYDLVEVDPETGTVTPVLNDDFLNQQLSQNPANPDEVAFVSNRDQSLDLYTLSLNTGTITKHSETPTPVTKYSWAPDGDGFVYQTGLFNDCTIRIVDIPADSDEVLIDEPDSEQALSLQSNVRSAWGEAGILFTTNHETGYREIAVADQSGDYDLYHVTETDKSAPQWTDNGDVVFIEFDGGTRLLRRLTDGDVTTVDDTGKSESIRSVDNSLFYRHEAPDSRGTIKQDGEVVVNEGRVDAQSMSPDEVTYESFDGTQISARLYRPDGESKGAIVQPHGGPPAQHLATHNYNTQAFVEAGFEVLAPDYRGSIGYGREFRAANDRDFGGGDLKDVVAGAEFLRDRGASFVGITGGSYGGYLTLMALATTDAFDAGVSVCGVANLTTCIENTHGFIGQYFARKLGTPEDNPGLYEDRSPITHVESIDVPLLVVQGAHDPRVPESEAEQLISSLSERDVHHEYLLFEDEGHGITRTDNRVEYLTAATEFITDIATNQ